MDHYAEDLAYIHDSGWRAFAQSAIPAALDELRARGVAPGAIVVELGCGSGIVARALADAGYDVLGIDVSPAMVDLARRAAPEARFEVGSWLDVDIPACAAVLAISEVLSYTADPDAAPADLERLLARVREALPAGGPFVFDLAGPGRPPSTRVWSEGPDWMIGVETAVEGPVLTRRMTTFREMADGSYRRGSETHVQRLFTPDQALALLRTAGFDARVELGYAGEEFAAGHRAYFARRAS